MMPTVADGQLRPSRFAAGHTVGEAATRPVPGPPAPPGPSIPPIAPPPAVVSNGLPTNRLAIAAFVLVVALGPIGAPVAVPIALGARRQCAVSGRRGAGLAKVAIFIGVAYVALATVVFILRLLLGG